MIKELFEYSSSIKIDTEQHPDAEYQFEKRGVPILKSQGYKVNKIGRGIYHATNGKYEMFLDATTFNPESGEVKTVVREIETNKVKKGFIHAVASNLKALSLTGLGAVVGVAATFKALGSNSPFGGAFGNSLGRFGYQIDNLLKSF